jgi:hypothetical protein
MKKTEVENFVALSLKNYQVQYIIVYGPECYLMHLTDRC